MKSFTYSFALSGHQLYELYFYIGIFVLLLSIRRFYRKSIFWLVALSHLFLLVSIFIRYDWFDWRHIRVSMWFIPFAYIFAVTLLFSLRRRWAQLLGIGIAGLLSISAINVNMELLFRILPAETIT